MKITLLIESLGSGGAERQLCTLAVEFRRRGHEVLMATYAPGDFYLPLLEKAQVEHVMLSGAGSLGWARSIRRLLRGNRQDVVLAFLEGPSLYAEIAALPWRSWGLVVSERIAVPNASSLKKWPHLLADYVTTNSHANRLMLEQAVPALKGRTVTVYNVVDLDHFAPAAKEPLAREPRDGFRFAVASSFQAKKNMTGLIGAAALLREQAGTPPVQIDWYGDIPPNRAAYDAAVRQISESGLKDRFRLHPATSDIAREYRDADAVILPSYYEGLPNAVCEAMACGKPVLMSNVCDAGNLVKPGVNGYLFDPASEASIAEAITRFAALSGGERRAFGVRSREMAQSFFDVRRIADHYIAVLEAAAAKERKKFDHWLAEVPESAYLTLSGPRQG